MSIEIKFKFAVFIAAFIMFSNTIGHDFAWDDSIVITENSRVQKGLSGIPDLFIKYNSDYKADKYGYRPIVLTSYALEYSIFNKNVHLMHLMNTLYYSLLCVVIFNVLRKLFNEYSSLVPFFISILFAAHPLHTEVVANIKSRDEIFAMLFAFLSLSHFLNYYIDKKVKHLIYAMVLFLIAFLSKESSIVFLVIIPLSLLYKSNWSNIKSIAKPLIVLLPLFIICFAIVKYYTSSTLGTHASKGAGIYYEAGILGNSFFYTDLFSSKLANALVLLAIYLKNFFYPTQLLYFYGYNQIPVAKWTDILVIVSLIIQVSLLAFAFIYRKKYKEISYGILFYFISIFIYLHLIRTIADTMADRFMFVPSLGLIIITVFSFEKLFKLNFKTIETQHFFSINKTSQPNQLKFTAVFIVITLFLSVLTFNRNKVWKNNETLITHDMPYLENCARAHNYYADIFKIKLNSGFNQSIETEMINHYKKSIQLSNESYYSFLGLGTYYCSAKKYSEGINVLNDMLQKFPNQADPHFYIGEAYYNIHNYEKAVFHLQTSLNLAPEVLNTYYFLALALSKNKKYDEAETIITKAKQKFGESANIYDALGNIYFDKGNIDQSTIYTFEMLKYGANPESVYGTVIGRYQILKLEKPATFYYNQALQNGLFRKQ